MCRFDPIYHRNKIGRNPEGMVCLRRGLARWRKSAQSHRDGVGSTRTRLCARRGQASSHRAPPGDDALTEVDALDQAVYERFGRGRAVVGLEHDMNSALTLFMPAGMGLFHTFGLSAHYSGRR
jgi:hypothetical protein